MEELTRGSGSETDRKESGSEKGNIAKYDFIKTIIFSRIFGSRLEMGDRTDQKE